MNCKAPDNEHCAWERSKCGYYQSKLKAFNERQNNNNKNSNSKNKNNNKTYAGATKSNNGNIFNYPVKYTSYDNIY